MPSKPSKPTTPKKPKKNVVRVEGDSSDKDSAAADWKPTAAADSLATKLRIAALVMWLVAIGGEALAIYLLFRVPQPALWVFILLMVGIAVLAVGGSFLWKRANRLDPASREDKVRFFVQNQLGAFIAVIAFLPLVLLILLDKDMDKKDKAILGSVGAVLMVLAAALSADYDPVSKEDIARDENIVQRVKGEDSVTWTKSGSVFHLCEEVPDVNRESADNTIYEGTVAEAYEAGKERLTKKWASELDDCGLEVDPALVDELEEASEDTDE